MTVSIDFGPQQLEQIIVTATDEPTEISRRFCLKKGFSTDLVAPLAEQIKMNMDKFFGKKTVIPPFTDPKQQKSVS